MPLLPHFMPNLFGPPPGAVAEPATAPSKGTKAARTRAGSISSNASRGSLGVAAATLSSSARAARKPAASARSIVPSTPVIDDLGSMDKSHLPPQIELPSHMRSSLRTAASAAAASSAAPSAAPSRAPSAAPSAAPSRLASPRGTPRARARSAAKVAPSASVLEEDDVKRLVQSLLQEELSRVSEADKHARESASDLAATRAARSDLLLREDEERRRRLEEETRRPSYYIQQAKDEAKELGAQLMPLLSQADAALQRLYDRTSTRLPSSSSLLANLSAASAQQVASHADELADLLLDHLLVDTVTTLNVVEEQKRLDHAHRTSHNLLGDAWEAVEQIEAQREDIARRYAKPATHVHTTTRPPSTHSPAPLPTPPPAQHSYPPSAPPVPLAAASTLPLPPPLVSLGAPLPSLPSLVDSVCATRAAFDAYQKRRAAQQFLQPHQMQLHTIVAAASDDIFDELLTQACTEVGDICDGYVERVFEAEFQADLLEQMQAEDQQQQR